MAKVSKQNIALVGFMAVGKSAVGRNLAKRLARRFVDLDRVIEKNEGKKVAEIFADNGEPYFRQAEKRALAQTLQKDGQVLATGGGVILDDENLALLRERTTVVGLTASIETLLARAGHNAKRPLLKGVDRRERIEELLAARQHKYAQAHFTVDTSNLTLDQVVDEIVERLDREISAHANVNG